MRFGAHTRSALAGAPAFAAAVFAAAGAATAVPPTYTVTDLGAFGGDPYGGLPTPRGVSNGGHVIGFTEGEATDPDTGTVYGSPREFVWQNGVMTNLSALLSAPSDFNPSVQISGWKTQGVNTAGMVVGDASDTALTMPTFWDRVGWYWTPTGGTRAFRPEPGQQPTGATWPTAVNDNGLIAGYFGGSRRRQGFIYNTAATGNPWTFFTVFTAEESAFGEQQNFPADINSAGWVAGMSQNINLRERGFVRKADGTITVINPYGEFQSIDAKAINNSGAVVGGAHTVFSETGFPRFGGAYVWTEAAGIVDLFAGQMLPPNFDGGDAVDINNAGQIVGHFVDIVDVNFGVPEYHPALWDSGVLYDLRTLISAADQEVFTISHAVGINDQGWIIALGTHYPYGTSCGDLVGDGSLCNRVLLLRPAAPPCRADFDASGATEVSDIFSFLSAWFGQESRADFDGSGAVDVSDIFSFLSAWFAGCD